MTQAQADQGFQGHPAEGQVDFPYMAMKVFSDFGNYAGKPLAHDGVEALRPFWQRIQELVSGGELSVALAQRCTKSAAQTAARLANDSNTLRGPHVSEAVRMVRAEAAGMAGLICR